MTLHFQSISTLRSLFTGGDLSPEEFIDSLLGRIQELNPLFRTFFAVLDERARKEAAQAEGSQLPLAGIPIAVKDNIAVAGAPTTCGMPMFASRRVAQDAPCVARLRQAGAVIIGKTQLSEAGCARNHPSIPPPVNPWEPTLWPGVSSHGSAVAVATGLATAALGTDTGGSIRTPAACNHLVGLKPTHGMINSQGVFPYARPLDHVGLITRTVEDAAALLDCLAEKPLNAPPKGPLTIGIDESYITENVQPPVTEAVREAAQALKKVDAQIKEVQIPDPYPLAEGWLAYSCHHLARNHSSHSAADREQLGPVLDELIQHGTYVGPEEVDEIKEARTTFRTELNALFESGVDLILAPAMPCLPPTAKEVETSWELSGPAMRGRMQFTAPYNFSGHPTLTLPFGFYEGRPRSVQLIAPHQGEANLILAGVLLQAVTKFHERNPFSD